MWVHNACGLTRNDAMLARELGGLPANHTPHHLIGVREAQRYAVMRHAADKLGYNVNRARNGIALPNDPNLAKQLNMPYHPQHGRHMSSYTGEANRRLAALDAEWRAGQVSDDVLLDRIVERVDPRVLSLLTRNRAIKGARHGGRIVPPPIRRVLEVGMQSDLFTPRLESFLRGAHGALRRQGIELRVFGTGRPPARASAGRNRARGVIPGAH